MASFVLEKKDSGKWYSRSPFYNLTKITDKPYVEVAVGAGGEAKLKKRCRGLEFRWRECGNCFRNNQKDDKGEGCGTNRTYKKRGYGRPRMKNKRSKIQAENHPKINVKNMKIRVL